MGLLQDGFECFWGKRLFGMDRYGHDTVMLRVVEIVMAPPDTCTRENPARWRAFAALPPVTRGSFMR